MIGMMKKHGGFTLIEVMIAVVILAIVIVPISMLFVGVRKNTVRAERMLQANEIASMYIENLKARELRGIELLLPDYKPNKSQSMEQNLKKLSKFSIRCEAAKSGTSYITNNTLLNSDSPSTSTSVGARLPDLADDRFWVKISFPNEELASSDVVDAKFKDVEKMVHEPDFVLDFGMYGDDFKPECVGLKSKLDEENVLVAIPLKGEFLSPTSQTIHVKALPDLAEYKISILDDKVGKERPAGDPKVFYVPRDDDKNCFVLDVDELKVKTRLVVDNETDKKITVFVINEEKNASGKKLVFAPEGSGDTYEGWKLREGFVVVEKGVEQDVKIKSNILKVQVEVFEKGETEPLVTVQGSVTNE